MLMPSTSMCQLILQGIAASQPLGTQGLTTVYTINAFFTCTCTYPFEMYIYSVYIVAIVWFIGRGYIETVHGD